MPLSLKPKDTPFLTEAALDTALYGQTPGNGAAPADFQVTLEKIAAVVLGESPVRIAGFNSWAPGTPIAIGDGEVLFMIKVKIPGGGSFTISTSSGGGSDIVESVTCPAGLWQVVSTGYIANVQTDLFIHGLPSGSRVSLYFLA